VSGPHDFAVRKISAFVNAPPASTASRPAFVTIASRPSLGRDDEGYAGDLGKKEIEEFSRRGLDTLPKSPDFVGEPFALSAHTIARLA
jgi:hypothetical protein